MLERYVLLRLSSDSAGPEELSAWASKALSAFPLMDGVAEFRVARETANTGSGPWHLAFTVCFEDNAAHDRYMRCAKHAEFDAELAMSLEDIQSFLLARHP
jgi:hypothetical protein